MKKTYVLDTNVLLQNPNSIFMFEDNEVIITDATIQELDKFKKEKGDRGYNARDAIRNIEKLRSKGSLEKGVKLDNGGSFKIEFNYTNVKLPDSWEMSCDNRVLRVCKGLMEVAKKKRVILVSQDAIMRIKADIIQVKAQDFQTEQVSSLKEQYTGRKEVYVDKKVLDRFFSQRNSGSISPDETFDLTHDTQNISKLSSDNYIVNQFVILKCLQNPSQTGLAYFDGKEIKPLLHAKEHPYGVSPRNVGQIFFQEALMRSVDEAPLVICSGPAGTAKTFYSLAVGLHHLVEKNDKEFRRILVCRPSVKMDEDIGFLPGTEQEKIAPYLRPIIDNLEVLVDKSEDKYDNESSLHGKIDYLVDKGILTSEAVAYLRGRSIVKNWIIIDEAQNLTPNQAKGIITRAGKGTKIILIGDPEQIDHPYLDERTNGLSYAAENMKNSKFCWQITMKTEESERSPLSQDAAERL